MLLADRDVAIAAAEAGAAAPFPNGRGYVTDGNLKDSVHFASGIALCQAAGCVVSGLRGQPVHTGVGGLLVAADQATHATLLALIGRQFAAAT